MKQFLLVSRFGVLLAGISLITSIQSTSSYAIAGIATLDPLLALGGLAASGGGYYLADIIQLQGEDPGSKRGFCNPNGPQDSTTREGLCDLGFIGAVTLMFGGLVALDDNGSYSLKFSPLNSEQAKLLGITSAQQIAFNSNIDEINAVSETMVAQVSKDLNAGMSRQDVIKDSQESWNKYGISLDSAAFQVSQKIAATNFQQ